LLDWLAEAVRFELTSRVEADRTISSELTFMEHAGFWYN